MAAYLVDCGLRVLARNLRLGRLELDVVAQDGRTIVVVEVRTRGSGAFTTGFGSIDRAKRLRIRRAAARLWRDRFRDDPSIDRLRFDAASVTFERGVARVDYCRAAF